MSSKHYFNVIINNLTFDEVAILSILSDKDATAVFKAMKRSAVAKESELSEAVFRKVIGKLTATHLVDTVITGKEHRVYLTDYGCKALVSSLKEVTE